MAREKSDDPKRGADIRESFARQGMMATLRARIDEIEHGRVVLSAPISPEIGQQHGFAHAGATFALGDSAAGYSALSVMAKGTEVLTVEMKINLIAPAAGERLVAQGEVVRAGRRLVIVRSTVFVTDGDGRRCEVAVLQGTMIPDRSSLKGP